MMASFVISCRLELQFQELSLLMGDFATLWGINGMTYTVNPQPMTSLCLHQLRGLIDAKQTLRPVGEAQLQPAVRPVAPRHLYIQRGVKETMLSTTIST